MRAVPAGKSTIILRPAVDHSGIFLTETKERDGGGIGSPPGRPGWPLRRTRVEASRTLRTRFLQAKKIDIPSLSAHHARLLHLPTSAAHIFPPTPSRIYILSPPFFFLAFCRRKLGGRIIQSEGEKEEAYRETKQREVMTWKVMLPVKHFIRLTDSDSFQEGIHFVFTRIHDYMRVVIDKEPERWCFIVHE